MAERTAACITDGVVINIAVIDDGSIPVLENLFDRVDEITDTEDDKKPGPNYTWSADEADNRGYRPPQPTEFNPSWVYNSALFVWEPPIAPPPETDDPDTHWAWDEENQEWDGEADAE